MTPRQLIKGLSVTSDPITTGLSQEIDMPPNDNCITNTCIHCHMFLNYIWSRRKLVQDLGNDGQE